MIFATHKIQSLASIIFYIYSWVEFTTIKRKKNESWIFKVPMMMIENFHQSPKGDIFHHQDDALPKKIKGAWSSILCLKTHQYSCCCWPSHYRKLSHLFLTFLTPGIFHVDFKEVILKFITFFGFLLLPIQLVQKFLLLTTKNSPFPKCQDDKLLIFH